MKTKVLINKKGMSRIRDGHPWVFRSDILFAEAQAGEIVMVEGPTHQFLGQAFFNPKSQITIRMLTRGREPIDQAFWKKRITDSIQRRDILKREACRLVFGESDFLPSLVVDRYRDVLVFQTLSLGMDRHRETILDTLEDLLHPQAIIERNDPPVRDLEGLVRQKGVVRGNISYPLIIHEGSRQFVVDPIEAQKTGLFLDQADNHQMAATYARGRVLDLFCYQGGFALAVSEKADEVLAGDSSPQALEMLRENCAINGIQNIVPLEVNAFDYLRDCQDRRERFDRVILDPPPFVRDRKNLTGGLKGYKEINLRAMKILNPGGILITCSCSQNFTPDFFEQTLTDAAHDAHRDIQILERRGASPDHPVLLTFPESNYLQCWVVRVV